MKESEMGIIAELITDVINNTSDNKALARIRKKVVALTSKFPVP